MIDHSAHLFVEDTIKLLWDRLEQELVSYFLKYNRFESYRSTKQIKKIMSKLNPQLKSSKFDDERYFICDPYHENLEKH